MKTSTGICIYITPIQKILLSDLKVRSLTL
jgi:hypothetical protein